MTKWILEARGLIKRYGDFTAVNQVSFQIEEGEIFGLLGPNGAGKTTTISLLSGLMAPEGGSVWVGGRDLARERQAVKRMIGVVPQELAFYAVLSARENLAFFGRLYGLRGRGLKARVQEALEVVGLSEKADRPRAGQFSGGMKRRLNLAIGLLHRPRLLFLDEPTVGVDPQSRAHIFENICRLNREEGMTILYTSHYLEEVELLCTRVGILDGGRLIAYDRVDALIQAMGKGIIQARLEGLTPELLARLRALPGIDGLIVQNGFLQVEATNLQQALLELASTLQGSPSRLTALEVMRPGLETVFLSLTGRRLRD
ncbi:MAG: ABC transporter ATP-binding protein [Candidatus Tectomicrobia bacterium]|uniref:ABC transporter ATP-binding protein n=1 Tax=Tectimicrobiota bacterium TaxID=2528274 RepID=A0A932FUV7_UNCTE|nr:ABC transporter ATP-binding protein [Candidatus Tectomicrobia bacterium]